MYVIDVAGYIYGPFDTEKEAHTYAKNHFDYVDIRRYYVKKLIPPGK